MADDTAALLKQFKIEQTDVFGYSLGGKVGLALAIRHPELVRRLAIFGAAYRSFEESFPPDVFKEATPETFAPKELKEPYEKMSPADSPVSSLYSKLRGRAAQAHQRSANL